MAELSKIQTNTTWSDAANVINNNNDKINAELTSLKSSTTNFKGYFTDISSLQSAFPNPKDGQSAWVGSPYPGTVYKANSGSWTNTSEVPSVPEVELNDYYDKMQVDSMMKLQDDNLKESIAELDKKTESISDEDYTDNDESVLFLSDTGDIIHEIAKEYANFKNLKSNEKTVLTTDDKTQIEEKIEVKQDKTDFINTEDTYNDDDNSSNVTIVNDNDVVAATLNTEDYDGEPEDIQEWRSDNDEFYASVTKNGVTAKGFYKEDGTEIGGLGTEDEIKLDALLSYGWHSKRQFSYNELDKACFVLVIDDANQYLPQLMVICQKYGFPLSAAIIPDRLNTEYTYTDKNSKEVTKKVSDICNEIVENGGEILCHSGIALKANSSFDDWKTNFVVNKSNLIKAGFNIRGIITAGGSDYVYKNELGQFLSECFFEYGDMYGTKEPYFLKGSFLLEDGTNTWIDLGRCWFPKQPKYTDEYFRQVVEKCCTDKKFVVFATHGRDEVDGNVADLSVIDRYLAIIKEKVDTGEARFTTWAYVYDNFGNWTL